MKNNIYFKDRNNNDYTKYTKEEIRDKIDPICPRCKNPLYFNLDAWGRTPWHLHCDICHINIGVDKQKKAVELIQKYNKKDTYLEYYDNNIHVLWEEGKLKIFKEVMNDAE